MCYTEEALLETLSNKFKPKYNKTIKLLQFCNITKMQKNGWADLA